MDLRLDGKSVLVTAASKGLGRATALEYAREGAKVTIASRSAEHLDEAVAEIREATGQYVHPVTLDVASPELIEAAVQSAVDAHGGLDVLVTNAGGPPGGSFEQFDDNVWQSAFDNNLMSVIRLIRASLPHMRAAGEGRIVNLSSISIKQPIQDLMLSNVFRAGVYALTKSLATELAKDQILVNTVAPGRILTDRIRQLDARVAQLKQLSPEEVEAAFLTQIPVGRYGTPEEFARYAVFLGSFANTYVTGQALLVDGGMVKSL
ncbi:SDR family oxidoreductase [Paenibacillus koleovorans]|uniref:SDR family oxidoreductase n=1 Tax=Paenibacillus koleovorans TaxID=121608 RepID=UPI000FDB9748|nr:SDR family oxidoreductase [Paenibacillus koleovorans]